MNDDDLRYPDTTRRPQSCVRRLNVGWAPVVATLAALTASTAAQPARPVLAPFDMTGFIQAATVDRPDDLLVGRHDYGEQHPDDRFAEHAGNHTGRGLADLPRRKRFRSRARSPHPAGQVKVHEILAPTVDTFWCRQPARPWRPQARPSR
jgi:hypothetical protein